MTTEEEEYVTLFCEGDGHVRLNSMGYPVIVFAQKERDVLDYIASLTEDGHCYCYSGYCQLIFNGSHCMSLLEVFSRHTVSRHFLDKLNDVLMFLGMSVAIQHSLTEEGFVAFWDAEGSSSNMPKVEIFQKEREILDLIVEKFGGAVCWSAVNKSYHWQAWGNEARELARIILRGSHCPAKRERLRQNFEGPVYMVQYNKKRNAERKAIREWMKTHPEEVARIQESS